MSVGAIDWATSDYADNIAGVAVHILLLFLLGELFVAGPVRADAVMQTQAMRASTIAEFFVEEERVVLELEIGVSDLEAFRLLMPDEIYERLGNPPRPWPERLENFFAEVFPIVPVENAPLRGRIVEMEPRPRLRRDAISGEVVPGGVVRGRGRGERPQRD